ncbi:MAG: RagB/SusD family nutrient uptake outer membrane protein, partial [Lachnospiraceae bacterium]|nr:RagB/SusD family nutrient uptake outer membrane protein [Lachnospiraceae bacterium]
HQRGCGFICWDDPSGYRSSYTYVGMVQKKLKDEYKMELTEKQIYGDEGDYLEDVQNAVEDLIIDEMALELAFEGSRFSDLYRVAHRRQNPDYLAKRVAKRHTGEIDEKLREKLQTEDSWFLPVPTE